MADDIDQQASADRSRVAAGEPYEVAYFAEKHGLTQKAARALIAEIGNDREKLDAAAEARTGSAPRKAPRSPTRSAAGRSSEAGRMAKDEATSPKSASARSGTKASRPAPTTIEKLTSSVTPAVEAAVAPVVTAGQAVRRRATAAVTSLGDEIAAAPGSMTGQATAALSAARRSSAVARKRLAAAATVIGRSAGKARGATTSAAKSRTAVVLGAAAAGLATGLAINLGRKVVVQAPSVMAGDWLEAVRLEHKMALGLFDAIERTSDTEPAKRSLLLVQLTHALAKHAFSEENVIYPALRDWGDKADADKLNHDHGYVKQHLYDLDALDPATPEFLVKIAAFRADLEAHIREEEDAIFPPLHATLGEAKNAAVTALANKEGFKLA